MSAADVSRDMVFTGAVPRCLSSSFSGPSPVQQAQADLLAAMERGCVHVARIQEMGLKDHGLGTFSDRRGVVWKRDGDNIIRVDDDLSWIEAVVATEMPDSSSFPCSASQRRAQFPAGNPGQYGGSSDHSYQRDQDTVPRQQGSFSADIEPYAYRSDLLKELDPYWRPSAVVTRERKVVPENSHRYHKVRPLRSVRAQTAPTSPTTATPSTMMPSPSAPYIRADLVTPLGGEIKGTVVEEDPARLKILPEGKSEPTWVNKSDLSNVDRSVTPTTARKIQSDHMTESMRLFAKELLDMGTSKDETMDLLVEEYQIDSKQAREVVRAVLRTTPLTEEVTGDIRPIRGRV